MDLDLSNVTGCTKKVSAQKSWFQVNVLSLVDNFHRTSTCRTAEPKFGDFLAVDSSNCSAGGDSPGPLEASISYRPLTPPPVRL